MQEDNWKHRSENMKCRTCMFFVPKELSLSKTREKEERRVLGRCRRSAPTMKGWPAIFQTDWCGDHKLDENKI